MKNTKDTRNLLIIILLGLILFIIIRIFDTEPKSVEASSPHVKIVKQIDLNIEVPEFQEIDNESTAIESDISQVENYIALSEEEKYHLATLIWLEGRGESIECQYAIGSVVINRYTTGGHTSILDVIYAKNQFQPAHLISQSQPSQLQIDIVNDLCLNGPTIPEYVTYFRADHYFNWDTVEDYTRISNTYFSYSTKLKHQLENQ